MTKRIAILGKGTAGAQSVIHFLRHMPDCEIQWHFDSDTPTQAVGEGSVLTLSRNMFTNLSFNYSDLDKIDGTIKTGIYKSGWGKTGKSFLHSFPPPNVALHFNAISLQNYIFECVKDKVSLFDHNVKSTQIDADFVMNCSGKPESFDDFYMSSYIPVNSVHVNQCYWEYPRFLHTLTIARPYGWVFGIPLQNRCSIGYLYNSEINTIDEIKEDIQNIFLEYNLIPSQDTNSFSFKNYYRKQNYVDNIAYNGNASFFLEPLEATSVGMMDHIQRNSWDMLNGNKSHEESNNDYLKEIIQIESVIMLHYFSGSIYDTEFWKFAKQKANQCVKKLSKDHNFLTIYANAKSTNNYGECKQTDNYGLWWAGSLLQNIKGLEIESEMDELIFGSYF